MRKVICLALSLTTVILLGCSRTFNIKWWQFKYIPYNGGFLAINESEKDTIKLRVGDKLLGDTTSIDISVLEWTDKDFYDYISANHSTLIKRETAKYLNDTTTYEYDAVPYSLNTEIEHGTIIHTKCIAAELYEKEWKEVVNGELSGQTFFTVVQKERRGWGYKNNITATTSLFYGKDWWGTPGYQLKTEITNISDNSWERRFEIRVEGYDKDHNMVGEETAAVDDFLTIGEKVSKTVSITDPSKPIIYAEYFRLFIDDVYFGEFLN